MCFLREKKLMKLLLKYLCYFYTKMVRFQKDPLNCKNIRKSGS